MSGETSKNAAMDTSSPYYVHHSDQPGHLLVPEKLNGSNYPTWSKSMIHALIAKNKIGFIDGTISAPSETEQQTEYAMWNQCNSMILSWLTHSVEPDLARGVIHAKSTHQVWQDLKDQFSQKNAPAIFQVQKAIATITQGTMSFSSYYTKIKSLWDELDTYRSSPPCNQMKAHNDEKEEDRLMQFLMGLNDTYKGVRSNILMMFPLPNIRQAYSLIIQEETQQQLSSQPTENFTIAAAVHGQGHTSQKNHKGKYCEHCSRVGHSIDECRTLKFHCNFCDKRGHTEDRCRLKNGQSGRTQQQRGFKNSGNGPLPAANMTDSIPEEKSSTATISGFSAEQLREIAKAVSMINSGNCDVYANATGSGYGEDDWLG